ncbi:DASH complex subunit Ask1-domain-containing protein [Dendryphion nanum]|uniref:DASH complex subunit ASK1 n=1 Tax=Dendryphion nanum TaxID=256645 RepID=A0A9P9DZB0_9PLEO|nr:DASH complex subunit Ask1-domain-containing protein [Dendryphion nanum]
MSRLSMAPQRNLSLTEELEKLEQSITLTLQEIDHNFSRAHRIVTTNILPIVEQYGKHSEAVWEGSKFWKQFFEASANVSLSGYEAPNEEEEDVTTNEETQESQLYDEDEEVEDTVTGATATPPRPSSSQAGFEDTSTLDSPSLNIAHSTPRAPNTGGKEPTFADYPSPYEQLRKEVQGSRTPNPDPKTPGKSYTMPHMSLDDSSPFVPPTTSKKKEANWKQDPVLHHVLDKTYRVMATPHTAMKQRERELGFTPGSTRHGATALSAWNDDSSPPSSPAPQLRADIFSSPMKAPRTPGVSVQTPAKGKGKASTAFSATRTKKIFESDSEEEEEFEIDFSPPKTMQFHIPQSRLLQTPAREASKRIVEDLLLTAGGDITESTTGLDDDSPSVVRRQVDLDDSF